jgi:hypothetical protein
MAGEMNSTDDALAKIRNPVVAAYLDLMNNTETPPIFHVWSLLSAASACMTRRCWFDMGAVKIMPNQFIMLVGAPGVRKSTAVNFAKELVKEIYGIRFAPNSTGGHLQGLLAAMSEGQEKEAEEDKYFDDTTGALAKIDLQLLGEAAEIELAPTHVMNRNALYVTEGELSSFLGKKQDAFINFLGDMWDKSGSLEHTYQIKREKITVKLPCLNMIGGITPTHITSYLPVEAVGQGFTSRVMLVYSEQRKHVPWPEPLDPARLTEFKQIMRWIFETKEGAFEYTPAAKAAIIRLYGYKVRIEDARFIHYMERRQAHLLKVAMALCAVRTDNIITDEDVEDAHELLVATEAKMTESLGEYGLSPMALARARISELLKRADGAMAVHRIVLAVGSDINRSETLRALEDMSQSGLIVQVTLRDINDAVTTGFAWPRQSNPFRQNQTVDVPYLVRDEIAEGRKPTEKSGLNKLSDTLSKERDVEPSPPLVAPKRELPQEMRATLAAMKPAVDPESVGGPPTLAEQGHATVADKLKAFLARRKE